MIMIMETYRLTHQSSGLTIATVRRLDKLRDKGLGVIGSPLEPGTGIWLPGVASIHTFLVSFSLDVLFLDGEFRTHKVVAGLRPWRPLCAANGARHTIELAAGALSAVGEIKVGDLWT